MEDRGFLSFDEQRGIWLKETREKLYEQIEGNFTTCQATLSLIHICMQNALSSLL